MALVNNVNSTLAQEKSHLVIPLRCGPEIAVPATKSFMNQMAVFYCLALHVAGLLRGESAARELEERREMLLSLPALIRETVATTDADLEGAAKLLYLRPSIHLLATRISAVAKEGALKIREVVLNHTEGFEGVGVQARPQHHPRRQHGATGRSRSTRCSSAWGTRCGRLRRRRLRRGWGRRRCKGSCRPRPTRCCRRRPCRSRSARREREIFDRALDRREILGELYADYPLLYITGPDERDVALTVSQINTHKIRGACTVVIAEEHPALRGAASKAPIDNPDYRSVYVTLPRTSDTLDDDVLVDGGAAAARPQDEPAQEALPRSPRRRRPRRAPGRAEEREQIDHGGLKHGNPVRSPQPHPLSRLLGLGKGAGGGGPDRQKWPGAVRSCHCEASRVQLASAIQRALPIGILGLALVGAPVLIFQPQGLPRMQTLAQELGRVEADNAELRRDIGTLRVEVRQLRDDPAAVERIARTQLGLVRKNEIVFQFGKGSSRGNAADSLGW